MIVAGARSHRRRARLAKQMVIVAHVCTMMIEQYHMLKAATGTGSAPEVLHFLVVYFD
jgi:hypothetical protein